MLQWPRMDAEFHGVSAQTGRMRTIKNRVSMLSEDASAWGTAYSMSSGSYSGLVMHELVHRIWKEFIIAPKTLSSGKAEQ